ncbi:MAG: tetratricopeptide repeat protein, partial [Leptospirales bacterium]|nr:tetratricopeptide repeat protein [Leptospirales bacterium]
MKKVAISFIIASFAIVAQAQDAEIILSKADSLSKEGNYKEAIALLEKNIKLFENNDSYDVSFAYNRLGNSYSNIEDYEKAKDYYLKYYDFRKPLMEKAPDKYVYWFSNNLSSLVRTYSRLNDYKNAVVACKENIDLVEKHKEYFKNYASDLAGIYGFLSFFYLFTKDFNLSEQAARGALKIDSTQTWVKTNLSHALLFQRKVTEAEEIYDELANTIYQGRETYAATLLEDFEQLEKANIVPQNLKNDFERIKANIGKTDEAVGIYKQFYDLCLNDNYDEAIALLQPYISILPVQHAQWAANVIDNKAIKYYNSSEYPQAEKYYLETKAIREKVLGKEHPDYATILNNLGALYDNMGNYAEAEKYHLETKAIREKVLGKEHPDYATTLNNLGALYVNMGNYAEAEKYHLETKAIREKVLGKEHPDYATTLNNLGVLYDNMG